MDMLKEIASTSAAAGWCVCILIVVLGAISCFLGYRLLKFWIGLAGFILGMVGGYLVTGIFTDITWIPLVVGVVVGILLALVAFKLYLASVFLICGLLACLIFGTLLSNGSWWAYLIAAIAGIAVGAVAVYFVKPVVILSTGFHGATNIVMALASMLGFDESPLAYVAVVILAIAGIVIQLHTTKDKTEKEGLAYTDRQERYNKRKEKKESEVQPEIVETQTESVEAQTESVETQTENTEQQTAAEQEKEV